MSRSFFARSAEGDGPSTLTGDVETAPDYHRAFARIYDDIRLASCTPHEDARVALRGLELSPGAHVLDWGCGTGIHARLLANAGYRVTGIDRSSAMLAIAESGSRCTLPKIHYVLNEVPGDSTRLEQGTFDAVCSFGNVLNCLSDVHAMKAALSSLSRLLRTQGAAFLDAWNIAPLVHHASRDAVREFTHSGRRYVQTMSAQFDPADQVLIVDYRVFVAPLRAEMWRLITSRHRLCILTLDQYKELFAAAGFQVKRIIQQRPRTNVVAGENDRLVSFLLQRY